MMGSSGRPLTIATVLLPSILLANGCAYAVHVVTAGASRRGRELEEAIASIALPVALSGTTTALGFLGTATVRIDAIRDVGTFGALGVMTATFAALTVVPAGIRLAPLSGTRREIGRWLSISVGRNLVALSSRYKALLIGGWTIAVVGSVFGILLLRVQTNVITWFPKDDPVRVAYEHIRARLSGISPINIVVEAPEGQRVTQPDVIEKIEELTTRAEALPEVGRAISIADALSELHSGLTGKTTKSLPNDPQMIEQYLLLLENKPYAQDFITGDRSAANIVIRVNDNGSDALLSVGRLLEEWWAQHGPVGFKARATGIMFEFGRSEDAIARGELSGIAAAFFPISLVLFLIFRSARLTLIALIPNVLPIAMAFGAMGLAGIPLDAGTVVVGSLALGIAVDDTIHVADGYLYYRLRGASAANALEWTYARSLPAICLSSTIIAVGFLVLAFSGFALTRNLGLITSALIMLCLSADLLLFAPLLMRYGPSPSEPKAH
jgi:predicted RND superfamily exporter protein